MFSKTIEKWFKKNQMPINSDIDERLTKLEQEYNQTQNRINRISNYIQEKLINDIQDECTAKIIEACKRYIDAKLNKKSTKRK